MSTSTVELALGRRPNVSPPMMEPFFLVDMFEGTPEISFVWGLSV
jgi:hypothetical protein